MRKGCENRIKGGAAICLWRRISRLAGILLLCLVMTGRVWAADADGADGDRWVFMLPSPEDDSECRFMACPSRAGYETDGNAELALTVHMADKSYDISLYPSEVRAGWYMSDVYEIAASAWEMDLEIDAVIRSGGEALAEAVLTGAEVKARWPETPADVPKLQLDGSGQAEYSEDEWHQWIGYVDSPLFEYKIDSQEGCKAVLDQDTGKLTITEAGDGGVLTLAAESPAGDRRLMKVNLIAAVQAGNRWIGAGAAVVLIVVIILAVCVIRSKGSRQADGGRDRRGSRSDADGDRRSKGAKERPVDISGMPGVKTSGKKAEKLIAAREDVEQVYQRLDNLVRNVDDVYQDMKEAEKAAEDRVRQEGTGSAYTLADIRKLMSAAEGLDEDVSLNNLRKMRDTLKTIKSELLKLQGNAKVTAGKSGLPAENPQSYLNEASRRDILSKIEADETVVAELYAELEGTLNHLKEIAYRDEIPFQKDMELVVALSEGSRQYQCKRAAKDIYGMPQPGVFALDTIRFLSLSGEDKWMTLPEILGHETGIRLLTLDEHRIRAAAERPVLVRDGGRQRMLELTYDEDGELLLEDARIHVRFIG